MRIEIPVNKRLQTKFSTSVKGTQEINTYVLRYERVPYFCFLCGFIGHDDTSCEKAMHEVSSVLGKRLTSEPEEHIEKAIVVHGAGFGFNHKRARVKRGVRDASKLRDGDCPTLWRGSKLWRQPA